MPKSMLRNVCKNWCFQESAVHLIRKAVFINGIPDEKNKKEYKTRYRAIQSYATGKRSNSLAEKLV